MSTSSSYQTWDRIFSAANFVSYAEGAQKLYESLVSLEAQGFTTLVYPSRGTTPFEKLVQYAHEWYPTQRTAKYNILHSLERPFSRATIALPFTADSPEDTEKASASIRDYWVQVLRAILHGELTNTALRFHQYTLDKLFGFDRTHGAPLHRPSPKFVFVDTVVSGRAVCEIAEAFERQGLNDFHLVLLVDESGQKLRSPYREKLDALEYAGRATRILIASIFTEDRGPAMTSTWCMTAPQLAEEAPRYLGIPVIGSHGGAAVSFVRVQADEALRNMGFTMLAAGLFFAFHAYMRGLIENLDPHGTEMLRRQLVDRASMGTQAGSNPLDAQGTKKIAEAAIRNDLPIAVGRRPIELTIERVCVSSSHVLRLEFRSKDIKRFLNDFKYEPPQAKWYVHEP